MLIDYQSEPTSGQLPSRCNLEGAAKANGVGKRVPSQSLASGDPRPFARSNSYSLDRKPRNVICRMWIVVARGCAAPRIDGDAARTRRHIARDEASELFCGLEPVDSPLRTQVE